MTYKCPHCGEKFARLVNGAKDGSSGFVPTHDFPKPCRSVCPGSGSKPRRADDKRPLWKDDSGQQANDFYDEARTELLLYGFAVVKQVALFRGDVSGQVACPLCQSVVRFSVASNGHCHAKCQRAGCIHASE